MPSPGYCSTPLIAVSEYGGTKTPRFLPSPFWKTPVSNVPSTIIATLPLLNFWIVLDAVRTSLFVQPLERKFAHFVSCETIFGDVHGIAPVYKPRHCAGE